MSPFDRKKFQTKPAVSPIVFTSNTPRYPRVLIFASRYRKNGWDRGRNRNQAERYATIHIANFYTVDRFFQSWLSEFDSFFCRNIYYKKNRKMTTGQTSLLCTAFLGRLIHFIERRPLWVLPENIRTKQCQPKGQLSSNKCRKSWLAVMATHGFFSHGSGQVCSSEFVVLKPETRNLQTDLVLRSLVTFHSSLFRYSLESVPHISAPPRCHHALHGNSLAPGEYRGRWDGPKAPFQALRLLRPFCSSRARKSDHGNQDFNQA